MSEGIINALHAIGTPVVIIAAAAITILMRKISHKLAFASGVITLVSVVAYVPIDLYPKARDAWSETKIYVTPNIFQPFLADMSPTKVTIVAKRGDEEITHIDIPAPDEDFLCSNQISLRRSLRGESFVVKIGQTAIGTISDKELELKGFHRALPESGQPQHIANSKRVYIGKSWSVNDTPLGKIKLTFVETEKENVVIKLTSSNYGVPQPDVIKVANKQFDILSFEGRYEVTVQVREANFAIAGKEWAAFTIIVT